MYGLPKEAPGAITPRSGVATGVGVVCESERTAKTEEKTRVWWSMAGCGGDADPRLEDGVFVVTVGAIQLALNTASCGEGGVCVDLISVEAVAGKASGVWMFIGRGRWCTRRDYRYAKTRGAPAYLRIATVHARRVLRKVVVNA